MASTDHMTPTQLRALDFAAQRHQGQVYRTTSFGTEIPYIRHLMDVFDVAQEYNAQHDILVAALLHDILEDTKTTRHELKILFGPHVANIVNHVTDEPGETRRERREPTLEKIATMREARELKLYDRIANARRPEKRDMYRKEHEEFSRHLRMHNENPRAWFELDKLLEPE